MRRRGGTVVAVLLAAAAALGVGGCASIPVSAPAEPPPVTTLVVGPQGLHDLPVGHAVPGSSALVHYGEHTCPNTGGWIPGYPEDEHNSAGQPLHPFDIVTARFGKGAPITDEYIWSKSIATARGIRVGSSQAQVRAAYPSASTTKSYSTIVYVVAGSGGKLLIEVALHNANAAGEWPATTRTPQGSGPRRRSERSSGCT